MGIKLKDLINLNKLGSNVMLVQPPEAYTKYSNEGPTDEIIGYKYEVVLKEYNWDKVTIKYENAVPLFTEENFKEGQTYNLKVEGLEATPYVNKGQVALSFKCKNLTPIK